MRKNILASFILTLFVLSPQIFAGEAMKDDAELVDKINLSYHQEIEIDRLPRDIWPYLLDYESWHPGMEVELIEGKHGEVGRVIRLRLKGGKPYYSQAIRVDPYKEFVTRFGFPTRELIGPGTYSHFRLTQCGGKTSVTYDAYTEMPIDPTPRNKINELRAKMQADIETSLENRGYMLLLKKIVEKKKIN